MPRADKPSIAALTGLRFFAASGVVVLHFLDIEAWNAAAPHWAVNLRHMGSIGIQLFFALSGFVLTYVYENVSFECNADRLRFWIARGARIYPLYLIGMLTFAPFFLLHRLATEPTGQAIRKMIAAGLPSLMLVQSWLHPRVALAWNGPGWTLSCELLFYLTFPVLLPKIRRLSTRAIWALWAVSMLVTAVLPLGVVKVLPAMVVMYISVFHVPSFVTGMLTCMVFLRTRCSTRAATLASCSGIVAVFVIGVNGDRLPFVIVHNGVYVPFFCLVMLGLSNGGYPARLLSNRLLVSLGEASYALYLLQYPVWLLVLGIMTRFSYGDYLAELTRQVAERGPAFFLLCYATLIAVSVVTYSYVERPARLYIKKRFAHLGSLQ